MNKYFLMNQQSVSGETTIEEAFEIIKEEMLLLGYRQRTISDYEYHLKRMCRENDIKFTSQLNRLALLKYLNSGNLIDSTRLIRLKAVRSVGKMFYRHELIKESFWDNVHIRVDREVKEGITEEELVSLISQLNFDKFVEYRDACVFLLIWENGVRLNTFSKVTIDMLDKKNLVMNYPSYIMKGRRTHTLPISKDLAEMLWKLHQRNQKIVKGTDKLFISDTGFDGDFAKVFSSRVSVYKKKFKLKNINPHAVRRGFAKRLLDKGVSVPIISKALGHKSIDTTTKYLHISKQELIDNLRDIL